jgi:hypothetical protein
LQQALIVEPGGRSCANGLAGILLGYLGQQANLADLLNGGLANHRIGILSGDGLDEGLVVEPADGLSPNFRAGVCPGRQRQLILLAELAYGVFADRRALILLDDFFQPGRVCQLANGGRPDIGVHVLLCDLGNQILPQKSIDSDFADDWIRILLSDYLQKIVFADSFNR